MARAISWLTALSSTTSARPREPLAGSARMRSAVSAGSTGAAPAMRSSVHSGLTTQRLTPVSGAESASGGSSAMTSTWRGLAAARRPLRGVFDLLDRAGIDENLYPRNLRTEILQRFDGFDGRVDADDVSAESSTRCRRRQLRITGCTPITSVPRSPAGVAGAQFGLRHVGGNHEREAAAAALFARQRHAAVHELDELAADGEAEPGAAEAGA